MILAKVDPELASAPDIVILALLHDKIYKLDLAKVKTKDIVMTKIVQNASELLSELSQITPMGPVTQVQEDKISDLGITPPSQLDPQENGFTMQVPFRVHERVGKMAR